MSEVHKQMHSINSHCLEVSAEFHVANYFNDVFQQTLQTSSFFYPISDSCVESLETALRQGNLLLDPRRKIEAVVEDLQVRRASHQLLH